MSETTFLMTIMHHRNLDRYKLIENKEEFRLFWLDANIDNSDDSIRTQTMLLGINPAAQFYTNSIECIDVIKSITNEHILFIISGSFARDVLPEIHNIQSIVGIFIFCANQEYHKTLMNEYNKIVDIFIDQDKLWQSIFQILNLLEKQAITISLFDRNQKLSKDLSKESASFLWHQLLIRVLRQMPKNDQSKEDLLNKCEEYYRFNEHELKNIDEFRKDYSYENAIQWYTDECFLYKLLNKALRTENIQLIYSFRFFIIDLCSEIENEYLKMKTKTSFKTYRGQIMSIDELEKLKNNIGKILSINGFFSTSLDIDVSFKFARQNVNLNYLQSIIFEIEVDPSTKTSIYADISHKAIYPNEKEILFNLNSLFKIISVDFNSIDGICKVQLKTTDEGTEDIEQHLKYIQQEIDECSPIIYFGWLLLNELGQVNEAEKYFQTLLKTLSSDHQDIASVYNGIGRVHSERNNLSLALENYETAYEIRRKQLPDNHSLIAASLHNIANIIKEKGNFDKALDYFQQALTIENNNHPDDHVRKAVIILNIGNTLSEKGDYDAALQQLLQALNMFRQKLPDTHPKISACLSDIGFVYQKKGDLETALDYYNKVLKIDEQCLPADHPHLSKDIKNIAFIYLTNKKTEEALHFCREKLHDLKNNSEKSYTRIADILIIMGKVNEEIDFDEACRNYNEALSCLEKSIPVNQRATAKCLHSIGVLYGIYKKFDSALENLLKALDLYRQVLASDHIDIADICRFIGRVINV